MMRLVSIFFNLLFVFFLSFSTLYSQENASPPQTTPIEKTVDKPASLMDDLGPQEISYWKEFSRMMMVLGAILGFVLLIAWFLRNFLNKRIKQVNQNNIIKILERRNLSQKSMVYLIEIYNKQYLIGDSASGGVQFLADCEKDENASQEIVSPSLSRTSKFSFMEILQKKLSEKQKQPQPEK